ncbi:MAG: hypothetical protein GWN29_12755 [Gammaproteobacteria bacterium]|nr:hypothetical protein [Gammaproteobacteria bacterium]
MIIGNGLGRMLIHWLSQWSGAISTVAVTLWFANWSAVNVEPGHGPFFLLVIAGFLISTLPNWRRFRR